MAEEKKYTIYTAADIEKYHKGLLSPKEMHALEKAALDDPFLADALEGYGATPVNISTDISELEKKLEEKISSANVISIASSQNSFKWRWVAAAIVILGGIGFLTFRFLTNTKNDSAVAKLDEKKSNVPAAAIIIDSNKISKGTVAIINTNKSGEKPSYRYSKKKPADTSFATVESDAAGVMTKTDFPPNSNYTLPGNDSIHENKAALGYAAPLVKTKNFAQSKKQIEGLAMSSEKEMTGSDQQRMNYFRGRIVDANSNPLPFANITNTRDNVGTYSDVRGNFTLISPDSVLDVQVRSVGFENNLTRLKNNVANNEVILQDDKTSPDKIISYQRPDTNRSRTSNMKFEEPEPADGWSNYDTYLANNINVPEDLKKKQNTGQVELSFEVNQNGDPVNIKVEKSLCQKCDEEAIRLIKHGPKWKKKNKKAKRITITVPFDTNE